MEIRLLGATEVIVSGESRSLSGARERTLVAVLALAGGATVGTDRLIDAIWEESLPANPQNALQALVSRLRRSIGVDSIETEPAGYRLTVADSDVDVLRFRDLVEKAAAEPDPAERSRRYDEALALWRGPAFSDFRYAEFALPDIAALEEAHLLATEGRIEARLEMGGGAELLPDLEELIAAHPLRESLRAHQMLALYRAGRQSDALRAFSAARRTLGAELGIEPGPELRALEEAVLLQDAALDRGSPQHPDRPPPTLPARLSSFVGRDREMSEVTAAFQETRLVTLTGAGGAGKTSLAIEVARHLRSDYEDGVWFVDLAPLTDSDLVADTLVWALGLELPGGIAPGARQVDPIAAVVQYLREKSALLVIDNCEHVIDSAATVAEAVLLGCPGVDVLATSRDRLAVPGEMLWRVPPLGLAGNGKWSDAVALFMERASAVDPGFQPTADDADLIVEMCRNLDGMPLAIELAAARTRSLSVAEVAERLTGGLDVLSGGPRGGSERQRTLEATIDWSYQLLGPGEQDLFARLAVLHGSFDLRTIEAAAPEHWSPGRVLGAIERLIDLSVVTTLRLGGSTRYRMLETLRVFASGKLDASGDATSVRGQLLDYYLQKLAGAEDDLRGPGQLECLSAIEADLDTVRSLLDWSVANAPDRGLRLAGMLGWFWYLRGNGAEARHHLGAMLDAASPSADDRSRGQAEFFLSLCDPEPQRALSGFEAARESYEAADDKRGVANATAMLAAWGSDPASTRELFERAALLSANAGYDWGVALIRFLQAGAAAVVDDMAGSARLAEEASARFADLGDRWGRGYSLYTLGVAQRAMGDYPAAEAAFKEAVEHASPMRLRREMAPVLSELASIATMRGDYPRAEKLLEQAQRYADEVPFAGSAGMVRNARGRLARAQGDIDAALDLHAEAVELYEKSHAHGGLAYSLSCLGFAEAEAGDLGAARSHHRRALEVARTSTDFFAVALALEGVGCLLISAGDAETGVELVAAGLAAREERGVPLPGGERSDIERAMVAATGAIGAVAVDRATARGRQMGRDRAVEVAGGIG